MLSYSANDLICLNINPKTMNLNVNRQQEMGLNKAIISAKYYSYFSMETYVVDTH